MYEALLSHSKLLSSQVDFRDLEDMKLIEKGRAKKLRRLHMEGLRVELTVCEHSIAIETKINEVQVSCVQYWDI